MYYRTWIDSFPTYLLKRDFFVLQGKHESIRNDILDMSRRFCLRQGIPYHVISDGKFEAKPGHEKYFIIDSDSTFNVGSLNKYRTVSLVCEKFNLTIGVVQHRLKIEKLSAPMSVLNMMISYDSALMINVIQASRYFGMSVVSSGLVKYLARFFVDVEDELALSLIKNGHKGILERVVWMSISLRRFLERLKQHLYNLLIVRTCTTLPNYRVSGRYGVPLALVSVYKKVCNDTQVEQIYRRLYLVLSFMREKTLVSSVASILSLW